ncbi:DUF2459 domain-containing protein [Rhodopila sp.]|uniref:DUF2459 domain-containing protein n=1 Tax=Rhodopila sp. TaxID=2480087 RepID=UPI003D102F0B
MLRRWVVLACLAGLLVVTGCSAPPKTAPDQATPDQAAPDQATSLGQTTTPGHAVIYVIGRGWHTDIGLPVAALGPPLAMLAKGLPGVRFLTFGFGERQFVVNRETSVGAMLAALLPSPSALLMTALAATPEQAFGRRNVVVLHVSGLTVRRIQDRIWRELDLSPSGRPLRLAEGPYPGSVFYAARTTYDGLYTCNTWTAETLRGAGLPIASNGVLFAGQVMGPARWIGARQAAALRR